MNDAQRLQRANRRNDNGPQKRAVD